MKFTKSMMIMTTMVVFSMPLACLTPGISVTMMSSEMGAMKVMPLQFSHQMNFNMKLFFFMVCSVTLMVLKYSETYMKNYNNKKFIFMLMSFFSAMMYLVSSYSNLSIMLGWEMLGLSSVFLVMFYPNNTSKYNSVLTMFYNRLGDILIIVVLSMMMMKEKLLIFNQNLSPTILVLITLSCFTKSAQFPLSSWLPAAMSAPTPISAMVHSSTLVTAGLFLLMMLENHMQENKMMMSMLGWASASSFMIGSIMATMEIDFKKVVAFSTMSQVSMMLIMMSKGLSEVAEKHMIFHAFFKTLLFCSAGYIFSQNWGGQSSKKMVLKKGETILQVCLTASMISMSGLVYSTSFYTKDLYLEKVLHDSSNMLTTATMFYISTITISYSMNLMKAMSKRKKNINQEKLKKTYMLLMFMCLTMMMETLYSTATTKMLISPQITKSEASSMMMIFFLALIKKSEKWSSNYLKLSQKLMIMKEMTYSVLAGIMKKKLFYSVMESDIMNFKGYYLKKKKIMNPVSSSVKKISYMITFLFLTMMMTKGMF